MCETIIGSAKIMRSKPVDLVIVFFFIVVRF